MAMVKAVFYLPIADNDGRDLTAERDEVEMELYVCFVGWSKLGIVQGAYRMKDGTQTVDEHRAYAILLDESRLDEVRAILREFKAKTTQEAIYLEVQYNVLLELI